MPELPEVETMRRGVLDAAGRRVESVTVPPCACRPIAMSPSQRQLDRRMKGRRIDGIDRRGKRLVIVLDNQDRLVIEPRMTGILLVADPPDVDHLRLQMDLSGAGVNRLWFWDRRGLGTVTLYREDEYRTAIDQRLGVDALQISTEQLRQKLSSSRRCIKVALLDQSAVAGIGNLYAAEILFAAGVDPRTRCDRLTGPQWRRIHDQIGLILEDAIRHEGSTLSDGTYRNALNDPGGYQNCHRVYDRAGQACPRCRDGEIRRIVQAQRSTFFCPRCQRRSGLHSTLREDFHSHDRSASLR
ncbi:bifunctional DNA-formamidopyrimidine glycosylase/DNA-(apurinic or apyrimidinic site) lyase [Crateriforma conspicua]|uniref:Formamidopyrimidine-DNA glycosylase n=1 Tax=Crateriforma conspicua TaxID=2527996 RepID=A0A5C5Y786_9PLAN|nr:bifunctional DNA-formamidopyrimidine glycosylase/DNA-(apurinic or apyrimidinic site) lyase [Crateriforma conspicua]QDV65427.1 Formamidopyrimidine-DNA glycosylase [Crateriforma conspicua]TWT70819.1 Formamidopyrimidine-DNA glycosylase [Crateriforma conspicua]